MKKYDFYEFTKLNKQLYCIDGVQTDNTGKKAIVTYLHTNNNLLSSINWLLEIKPKGHIVIILL